MKSKIRVYFFIFFACVIFSNQQVLACMCGHTSISDAYKEATGVVIAEVKSVKHAEIVREFFFEDGSKTEEKIEGQEVLLKISKRYKGRKTGSSLKLSQINSTCDWFFDTGDLNKKYLLYLSYNKKYNRYGIISCGRSNELGRATDDLFWLKGLPNSLKRTRLSGTVRLNDGSNSFPPVSSIKIKIVGKNKEYNLVSGKNGLYEIWDITPGKYTITAEIPENKQLSWTTSVPENWTYFWSFKESDYDALKVTLNPKSSAGIDFMLENK